MNIYTPFVSRALTLPHENVDTDQITPARFLRGTSKDGMGEVLFADWRKDPDFMLNHPDAKGSQVLVAGDNFGCGSSREHAPWALVGWGFRAIVSTSFADIFKNNSLKNGLLPIVVEQTVLTGLFAALEANPAATLGVNLQTQELTLPNGDAVSFTVDSFARHCLLNGIDELGYLLSFDSVTTAHERDNPHQPTLEEQPSP
jgi:3-isopropylmalate/(R)-2-methylmalate dehydratase small subunit